MYLNSRRFVLLFFTLIFIFSISSVNAQKIDYKTIIKDNSLDELYHSNYTDNVERLVKNKSNNKSSNIELHPNYTQDNDDKWDKNRPIYFAMDHANENDKKIRDNIVKRLKDEDFNVIQANIGPNEMHSTLLYLYENNVENAVIFHLLNGVDPSNIRELARNGDDNRGRIVRSRGNDVVLAWFYDSADPVNENGSCYDYVRGSETGSSLKEPKKYMDENDIVAICTSSDMGKHKETADYDGTKTVDEFIKLFKNESKNTNKSY